MAGLRVAPVQRQEAGEWLWLAGVPAWLLLGSSPLYWSGRVIGDVSGVTDADRGTHSLSVQFWLRWGSDKPMHGITTGWLCKATNNGRLLQVQLLLSKYHHCRVQEGAADAEGSCRSERTSTMVQLEVV